MGTDTKLRAKQDAERMRNRAFWNQVFTSVRGIPNELLAFDEVKKLYPSSESYGGVKAIEIDQIVGSVDRYRDFDHYFLPRFKMPLNRWVNIRRARLDGVELPAIQVYKVGDIFFVKDGHHRVSVAKDEGQRYIDAEIIELNVPVELSPKDSLKDLIIKSEYSRFLEATGLNELRPMHDEILFSVTGRYDVLLEHIQAHLYYLGKTYKRDFSWQEAVMSWYDTLYCPVITEIREHHMLKRFPGRTEADLYLWIMDHRFYLAQASGADVGTEQAAKDYAAHYAPNPLRRLWQRVRNVGR